MLITAVFLSALFKLVGANINTTASSANTAQFPYLASLRRNNTHFCEGSIINANTILTAAHCVHGLSLHDVTVVVGRRTTVNNTGTVYPVLFARYHEYYDPKTTLNDVAVVKLFIPMIYNENVRKIGLSLLNPYKNEELILQTHHMEDMGYELDGIKLQAVDLMDCAENLKGAKPVGTGHLCTSSVLSQGASNGDSGGPLIDQHGLQVGIVSWGVPDADGHPDVFTSVSFYINWILKNI